MAVAVRGSRAGSDFGRFSLQSFFSYWIFGCSDWYKSLFFFFNGFKRIPSSRCDPQFFNLRDEFQFFRV
ncbi:hypothetical protein RchiOBHm_Chr5g0000101 [Rosa chinensis]|uniref:Uncharacterized protein n=1 Tax=Rosa chinensis TaxID=74649 RepID=A0A2P6Q1X3_ROSCH|nr:hypothetical protein RchiOBHm_Chr5g0000101 [Rosa chinensis]